MGPSKHQLLTLLATVIGQATARFLSIECAADGDNYVSTLYGFDQYNVAEYMADLRDNGVCTVPAGNGNCVRVSCGNTSGVWMCNDTEEEQSVDCAVIADYVNYFDGAGLDTEPNYNQADTIMGTCQCGQYSCTALGASDAGQIHDDQGFAVIAAAANCNVPVTNNPSQQ